MEKISILGIILGLMVLGGILYGQGRITKTDAGLLITETHTWYESRIIWGEGYVDHDKKDPVHNTEVVAFGKDKDGNDWEYSTTTNDEGYFKVEVAPDVPFRIKASDGNDWSTSYELEAVPEGTTKKDKS